MFNFGKISWKESEIDQNQNLPIKSQEAFNSFLHFCRVIPLKQDLFQSCNQFMQEQVFFKNSYNNFIDKISQLPFIAAFLLWIKEVGYATKDSLDDAKLLIENEFIGFFGANGENWTIANAKNFDHQKVLTGIRCKSDWSYQRRERLVQTYILFINWLSKETNNFIAPLEDPDRLLTKKRKLSFGEFIEFLDALQNEKAQLVAKILYFSNKKSFDDVLKIDISQVSFEQRKIFWNKFDEPSVYPEHIFNDIQALIGSRTSGLLFLGRQNAPLNQKTIFTRFQRAAELTGVDSFNVRYLSTNDIRPTAH